MNKKYFLLVLLGIAVNLDAQNCTPARAGNNIGDNGCVLLNYRNKAVTYKTVRASDGNEWLQQNLGSSNVAATIDDEGARGDYFQYGRWDDGHQLKTSQTSEIYPVPNNPLGLGEGKALFYVGGGSPWAGNYNGWFANPDQNDGWSARNLSDVTAHNGIDPCKAIGDEWEIPSEADWDLVMQKELIFPRPSGATSGGIVRGFESNLKIAGAGARKDDSWSFVGSRAYIWTKSASTNPNFYRYVYLGAAASSTTGFGGDAKSFGYSVRCVNKSNNTLAINDHRKDKFYVAPNPATNMIKITADTPIDYVEVLSLAGQKIYQTDQTDINVSQLERGIYLIKIEFKNGDISIKKILKN